MRLRLGRLLGIDVYLHWTFFLVPAVLVYLWRYQQGLGWLEIGGMAGLVASAFACVLMHEYGHALAARRIGIATRDIIITPIGGLARLENMSRHPMHELFVTLAGPLVNLVLACLLFLTGSWMQIDLLPPEDAPLREQALPIVLWLNVALFLFNLLPAFPMDGGRILRSVLAMKLSYGRATRVAVFVGQIMAAVFIGLGVYLPQWSLIFIAVFVFSAAVHELRQFEKIEAMEQAFLSSGVSSKA